ncbi:MAG: hypothetical protein ABI549_12280 [Flavobacterium sp.]|uniref:hypothetical protein n=1 Tax=Flavobacterium sp. TaxID=239 RepID=UPI0032663320
MKNIFYNPFERYSEKKLLLVGTLSTIIGCCLAYIFNVRYDGVLDLHFTEQISYYETISYLATDILILTFSLIIIGKYINKKTRFIDILTTVLISRIPFYFASILNINNKSYIIGNKILALATSNKINTLTASEIGFMLFETIILIAILIWSIFLLYKGYKTATNSKETKHTLLFILAILFAEIISKVIIYKFL